jgi:tetratricopeptide (TPR) repeat protein
MKSTKCVVCSKVKGKRICQLHAGAFICPRCCAQIRHADCEGCSYYAQAEAEALKKTPKPNRPPFMMRIDPEGDEVVDNALALIERGAVFAGESILVKLLKQHPDLHTVQFAMGMVRAKQKRYDEAIRYLDRAIAMVPDFVEAWYNKGVAHKEQLDIEGMIRAFQRVLELGHPANELVQRAQESIASFEQHLRQESGATLDEYLQAKEQFDHAFSLMEKRHWPQVIEGFQAVVALNPTHPPSYGNMGICYGYLGCKQEALVAFDRALALDPSYEPARLNRQVVAALVEGEKLPESGFRSVAYYRDAFLAREAERR